MEGLKIGSNTTDCGRSSWSIQSNYLNESRLEAQVSFWGIKNQPNGNLEAE
jgi:hypothetical protein